jgi:hypothetical protein
MTNPQFNPNVDLLSTSLVIGATNVPSSSIGSTSTYVGICPAGGYGTADGTTFWILIGTNTHFTRDVQVGDYLASSAQTPPLYVPVLKVVSDTVLLMSLGATKDAQYGLSNGSDPYTSTPVSWGDGTGFIL